MTEFLQDGINEYKAGNKNKAREIFRKVVNEHPDHIKAWEWLLQTAADDFERVSILEKILAINPAHVQAQKIRSELIQKLRRPADQTPQSPPPKAIPPSGVASQPQRPKSPAQTENDRKNLNLVIFGGSLLLICGICFCLLFYSDRQPDNDHKTMASVICEFYVEDSLKSPSTADFQPYSSSNVRDLGDNTYEMTSYVDAQNGFGAMIRTNYYCKVQYTGTPQDDDANGRLWKLLDLQFFE